MRARTGFLMGIVLSGWAALAWASGWLSQEPLICHATDCVRVEVMRTEKELQRGLQGRRYLPDDAGMLFVFDDARAHRFWMKDTWIPLDMIWMDAEFRVVHMETDVPPCRQDPCPTYGPSQSTRYVLEVNAGYAAMHGLKPSIRFTPHLSE